MGFGVQRGGDPRLIADGAILRQLELRRQPADAHAERDDRADERIALPLGHRELPGRRAIRFEPVDERVEHAPRLDADRR